MENDMTNDFEIPEEIDEKIEEGAVYVINWGSITILNPRKKEEKEEVEEEEEGLSEWEIERQDREERKTTYKEIKKRLEEKTHDFVMDIVDGKLDDIDKTRQRMHFGMRLTNARKTYRSITDC